MRLLVFFITVYSLSGEALVLEKELNLPVIGHTLSVITKANKTQFIICGKEERTGWLVAFSGKDVHLRKFRFPRNCHYFERGVVRNKKVFFQGYYPDKRTGKNKFFVYMLNLSNLKFKQWEGFSTGFIIPFSENEIYVFGVGETAITKRNFFGLLRDGAFHPIAVKLDLPYINAASISLNRLACNFKNKQCFWITTWTIKKENSISVYRLKLVKRNLSRLGTFEFPILPSVVSYNINIAKSYFTKSLGLVVQLVIVQKEKTQSVRRKVSFFNKIVVYDLQKSSFKFLKLPPNVIRATLVGVHKRKLYFALGKNIWVYKLK